MVQSLIFCCRADNDLYRALTPRPPRFDVLEEALAHAPTGAGILALADEYPVPTTFSRADWDRLVGQLVQKQWRVLVEYPAALPDQEVGAPRVAEWERIVVSSDWFEPSLPPMRILAPHGCWFTPVEAASPHLVMARVAGYHTAVYGLPEQTAPILFALPGHEILVATSKLSQFVTGRYAPVSDWKALWERLLGWLGRTGVPDLSWTPIVRTQAGENDPLPEMAEVDARRRSLRWFREHVVYSIDWKKGALEGFESRIDHRGHQLPRAWPRGDCTAETALVFAYDWALTRNPDSRRLAIQILDTLWSAPDFRQADAGSPAYGLNNWYERGPVFYGDDNARVILSTLSASRLLGDDRWDEHVLRCLLANLRTTGAWGFRRNRIDLADLVQDGRSWQFFQQEEVIAYHPHYQAYLWAAFLWAYALTRYEGLLQRTRNAIRLTMEAYPGWRWTNGFTQELARMLLPLAFLCRIEDTPEHRRWLRRIADDLLVQMQPCGAIQERTGPLEHGRYPPPRANDAYGVGEASLIQQDGDPACDLLYTANYAFLGLHEAAYATGDARLGEAEDRLAAFLCRVQLRSEDRPYLDGAWMRSFDYMLWEYWGSSADLGWGAWSVESGWTNAWIASVLAMRHLGETLFDLGTAGRLAARLPELAEEMGLPST